MRQLFIGGPLDKKWCHCEGTSYKGYTKRCFKIEELNLDIPVFQHNTVDTSKAFGITMLHVRALVLEALEADETYFMNEKS